MWPFLYNMNRWKIGHASEAARQFIHTKKVENSITLEVERSDQTIKRRLPLTFLFTLRCEAAVLLGMHSSRS